MTTKVSTTMLNPGTGSMNLPSGTTAQRSGTTVGSIRYKSK